MSIYIKKVTILFTILFLLIPYGQERTNAAKTVESYFISDMATSNFGYQEINDFLTANVIDGFSDKTTGELHFKPNQNVTRAQFAKILLNVMGVTPKTLPQGFSDVPAGKWYTNYINTAQELGIISGYKDGKYRPGENITRAQIAAMIVRAFEGSVILPYQVGVTLFKDVPENTTFSKEINQATTAGIISGYTDGNFKPTNLATRAQAVVMIYRATAREEADQTGDPLAIVLNYLNDEATTYRKTGFDSTPLSSLYNKYGTGYFHTYAHSMLEFMDELQAETVSVNVTYDSTLTGEVHFQSNRYAEVEITNSNLTLTINDTYGETTEIQSNSDGYYYLKKVGSSWKIYNYIDPTIETPATRVKNTVQHTAPPVQPIPSPTTPLTLKEIINFQSSVVMLNAYDELGEPLSQGSGFVVTDHLIASNFHVVEGATRVEAITHDGRTLAIEGMTEYDFEADLVLLKSTEPLSMQPLQLGSIDMVEKGDEIVTIGSPAGLFNTVSTGIVSGIRDVESTEGVHRYIQFTAPITFGSSGGPLFSMYGHVVGVNSMGYDSGNLNFAIGVDHLIPWVEQYKNMTGSAIPAYGYVGNEGETYYEEPEPETSGIYIEDATFTESIMDPVNPLIYSIDKVNRKLFITNYETNETTRIQLTYEPSGLSLSKDGTKAYIVNKNTKYLSSVYDLATGQRTEAIVAEMMDAAGHDNDTHRHVYEQNNMLFIVIGAWAPKLYVFDAITYKPIPIPNIENVGSITFTEDGTHFYYWHQYGWNAGWMGSDIYKYRMDGNQFTLVSQTSAGYPYLIRDPLDAPLILLEDRNEIISKDSVFDTTDMSLVNVFPEPIYAASSELGIAVGKNGVYDLDTSLSFFLPYYNYYKWDIERIYFKGNEMFVIHTMDNTIYIERIDVEL